MRNKSGAKIMNGLGVTAVVMAIIMIFVFITTILGGSLLKFLGMEYESFWSVFLFFIVYFIVDFPVDMVVDAFPRAMTEIGRIKSAKMGTLLYILLDIPINCLIMLAIDHFMDSVRMPFPAVVAFSSVLCALNLFMAREEKKQPVRVYLWEKDGDAQMESRELLMEALELYCADMSISAASDHLKIEKGPHGKPYAAQSVGKEWVPRNDLFFSVSHTRSWWMCAVHNAPIGVDIEEQGRRVNLAVADRFFTSDERAWLAEKGATADNFLELWVRKEAYVKYLGTGLTESMGTFSVVAPIEEENASENDRVSGKQYYELSDLVGSKEKSAFCSFLFPKGMKDMEGYPVPLIGAFCTEKEPEGVAIGFLERGPQRTSADFSKGESDRDERKSIEAQ